MQVESRDLLTFGGQSTLEFKKGQTNVLSTVQSMLFHKGKWELKDLKQMETPRVEFSACFLGEDRDKIAVAGGRNEDNQLTASCEIYDIHTNEWT
jgi:hypothetical protein